MLAASNGSRICFWRICERSRTIYKGLVASVWLCKRQEETVRAEV